jgi:hypothetical protein
MLNKLCSLLTAPIYNYLRASQYRALAFTHVKAGKNSAVIYFQGNQTISRNTANDNMLKLCSHITHLNLQIQHEILDRMNLKNHRRKASIQPNSISEIKKLKEQIFNIQALQQKLSLERSWINV